MHLAFVTSLVPGANPSTGYEVANRVIIDGLRALGHKVSVFGFAQSHQSSVDDKDTHVLRILDVENARASSIQKISWMMKAVQGGIPVGAAKLKDFSWSDLQSRLQTVGPFDRILINSFQMAAAFPQLLDGLPFNYIAHNVEHETARQNAREATTIRDRFLYEREARLLEILEADLCQRAEFVWFLSHDDRQALCQNSENANILPLVSVGQKNNQHSNSEKRYDVGLIGTWTWQPNKVGLEWFLSKVAPLLDSNISVAIAGSTPPELVRDIANVKFAGRVKNAGEFVGQSRLIALVSQGGTGIQLKTIEAFQSGVCCVATSSSLRGIEHLPENCRSADNPVEFANEINTMIAGISQGWIGEIDGNEFYQSQYHALLTALSNGLNGTTQKHECSAASQAVPN